MGDQKTSDPVYIFLAFFVLVEYIGVIVVNALASLPNDPTGWFRNSTGDISDKYDTDITPAGFTFIIWSVIYIWQAIWIIYVIANIFRTNKFGKVYVSPPVVPTALLATYAINLVLNVAWLFTWDRQQVPVAFVILFCMSVTLYVCLILSYRAMAKHIDQLHEHHRLDLWLNAIFIQNGLTIYATWCTIATLINFTAVLAYFADLDQEVSCYIALSILTSELIVYVICENFLFFKHLRTTFMAYPVVIWAVVGVFVNNWDPENPSGVSMYTIVVLSLACVAQVFKTMWSFWLRWKCVTSAASENKEGDKVPMGNVA